jgi:hypothetical protein
MQMKQESEEPWVEKGDATSVNMDVGSIMIGVVHKV